MSKYIYGKNSVLDAIKNALPIKKFYLQHGIKLHSSVKNVQFLNATELNKLINGNHQGYIAEIEEFKYYDIGSITKDKPQVVLVLDHIQDPQNFGAILRSANCFAVQHIIIPKNRACDITPTVLKVSSGGFNNAKIIKVASLQDAINLLKKNGFWIYASALSDKSKPLSKTKFVCPIALIVGNEETGVSTTLQKQADEIIKIEQYGSVQSLNVSVATGILLHQITNKLKEEINE
ncbi:23S rRNA (guanosine(2251)-2'-O)-methyltransferase RlmB [Metamycoplasma hyosynoviae]|uniref:23S rRNA (guanosine(2251)-2'-O)-methyltransferase RlmB n=1 Tax=Metamycoplasma hyosynoviae TaxID=29559 RepID=UPI00235987E3|nr:23S rRNA (guanosine(2251)-2'-O)-methyltransferase RlmB [Metamycoplasma hyosynoviae]MDC8914398.1 23S rRNA (guanosine(2251)-2'-O)-methyltransferase RlmB [Metamycoplasma hyosynoviae]MDC8916026.1 23S rRNA (guanosine(2251)-2'-O)-methyltransferase RlmB [Metamycoplasma hyosynoviae]MDC8921923.1 23S rRNA (guanosine(2251)-2'-O)-methyltransferase RlmB [Metamycoplasma hyosynoviae]MDC8927081.1 23S rRNA (guanosine(2251)-2'-O)-methyltransferase RlmB [Metamycoplasma hyosynoviae]MDD1366505.1 23S rRNA (guano